MANAPVRVGTVHMLFRYPVKSMRGETLQECGLGWHGLAGDRRYAFLRPTAEPFPWLTARQQTAMIRYQPRFRDPAHVEESVVEVETPEGTVLPLDSSELLERIVVGTRFKAQLIHLGVGAFDSMPVSLISRQSVGSIGDAIDAEVDARQFRPNVVLDLINGQAYDETTWLGATLAFGNAATGTRLRIDRINIRCMVTGLDPATASNDPAVLYHVVNDHDGGAGIYGTPERLGQIRVGDPVFLERS